MSKTSIVDWKTMFVFVVDAFVGYGIPKEDAKICAERNYCGKRLTGTYTV